MVDGSSRMGAFCRILLPLVAPGPRRDLGLRLHHELERVHLRLRPPERPVEADDHRVAVGVLRDEPSGRLGRPDGGLDPRRDPGSDLLRVRAAQSRIRADDRGGEGLMGEIVLDQRQQGLRQRLQGDRRRLADDRRRRVHGAGRPLRLWQVDAAADDRRARGGDRRDGHRSAAATSPSSRHATATSRWSSRTTPSTRTWTSAGTSATG